MHAADSSNKAARIAAARGDLWLDEIWSLELARIAGSVVGVFTAAHHDNNHHLNTIWLLLLGPDASPLALRLPAVVASGATIAVAAASERRRDAAAALVWAVLLAGSYVLVHYGSEARGYALALLFAMICFASMEALARAGRPAHAVSFAVSAVLGLLSHLTFLYVLLAFGAWGLALALSRRTSRRSVLPIALSLAVPATAFVALWAVDLRFLVVGGGPPYELPVVLRRLSDATLGLPGGTSSWIAVLVLALAVLEIVRMARESDPEWTFFATVLLVGPAVVLALTRPPVLAPRYFLVAVPFLLLLLARAVSRFGRRGRVPAFLAAGAVAAFLAGNSGLVSHLLVYGRGTYREAIAFVLDQSPAGTVTVGSDNDFRNAVVLEYHAAHVAGGERLLYLPEAEWTAAGPEWGILHRFEDDPPGPPFVDAPSGRRYLLVRVFPYAGLSGWDWYLYRLEPPGSPR